jgi:hypothetical protein
MNNQRGEIVIGLMVVMMSVMMFLGGLHMMHGGHGPEGDRAQIEHQHDRDKSAHHHHDSVDERDAVSAQREDQ